MTNLLNSAGLKLREFVVNVVIAVNLFYKLSSEIKWRKFFGLLIKAAFQFNLPFYLYGPTRAQIQVHILCFTVYGTFRVQNDKNKVSRQFKILKWFYWTFLHFALIVENLIDTFTVGITYLPSPLRISRQVKLIFNTDSIVISWEIIRF